MDSLESFFIDYQPVASLLHGDLWSGNVAYQSSGRPIIFDPACYYGDRETDIAMTELFGSFALDFYAAYRATWPLDVGYDQRKPLYQLYHLLNHFNLFGGSYAASIRQTLIKIQSINR
jgi:fructosamine-3-kinase